MSGRRASNNRIRGPQSALTDFLAANNISAAQISADYERRRREAQEQAEQEAAANGTVVEQEEEEHHQPEEREETALQKKKRKRAEDKAREKIKESKNSKKQKKNKKGGPDGHDSDAAFDMYSKSKPLPGQLENCETCEKRFTVTPYSKTGPEGGLLCKKCSMEQETQKKKDGQVTAKKHAGPREKRRQTESSKLDGIILDGAVSLQDLCIRVCKLTHMRDRTSDMNSRRLRTISITLKNSVIYLRSLSKVSVIFSRKSV